MSTPVLHWLQDIYSVAVDKLARKKLPVVGAIAARYYRFFERKCFRAAAGIIAISEDFLPILHEFGVGSERVTVIPNWAPLEELLVLSKDNEWTRRHGLEKGFCFLYSETLAMKHNPDLLLQLALRFRDRIQVSVVVVSEGPGAEWLAKEKASQQLGNLLLLPFQDFSLMPQVLASADVLLAVLESDAGVFSVPSKVLTYLCAGRAILAAIPTRNLAARTISEADAGRCVDPQATNAFLAEGEQLWQNADQRKHYGHNARGYAEHHFDIERIADQFQKVLEQAVNGTNRVNRRYPF